MGGIALMMHEVAHWYFNRQYSATTEVQFWGLGAIIMALTAWLFGSVFSQPTLTTVESREPLPKKVLAYITLAGPALSLLIAILCLLIIPLGGLFRTAGTIGLSVNMLTAVFSLLPVKPCEGHDVYLWSKAVWAVAFFPLLVLYFLVNL
jgi:Zn-dependent protease